MALGIQFSVQFSPVTLKWNERVTNAFRPENNSKTYVRPMYVTPFEFHWNVKSDMIKIYKRMLF